MTHLSVIITSFNTKKLTVGAIESVLKNTKGITLEIIVIDNNSTDGSVEALKELASKNKEIILKVNKENLGFGQGNNQGMKIATGNYILLLNSDTLIKDSVLGETVSWMESHPKAGIASCTLKNEDGSIQGTGGYFPTLGRVFAWMTFVDDLPGVDKLMKSYHPMHDKSPLGSNKGFYEKEKEMDWLTAAYFMIRRETYEQVGGFDKDYFMYVEEVDYCYRAKKLGWQVWYLPALSIIHYGGASADPGFSLLNEMKGLKTFYKKHMPSWQFQILRFLLKLGTLLRIIIFGKSYAKIFVSV